uniref:Retrovirus-related Pol polyprotein from transposon TNT 1-94 n=1 Tax=Cannabis sativa TaxID=3483 RepID=A0A803PR45_CANSA
MHQCGTICRAKQSDPNLIIPRNNSNNNRGGGSNRGRGRGGRNPKPTCQVCGRYGHSAAICYNSNHLTANQDNMSNKSVYNGKDRLTVGDGNQLHISHVGSSTLQSDSGNKLLLNDVLHVPKIAKNLISISKLTADNKVFVEFFSDVCFVKDMETKMVVLRGRLKDGLYQLQGATKPLHLENSSPGLSNSRPESLYLCFSPFSAIVESMSQSKSSSSSRYSEVHKGYKCLSSTGRLYISRHVQFNERDFPFSAGFLNNYRQESDVTISSPDAWFELPIQQPDSTQTSHTPEPDDKPEDTLPTSPDSTPVD